MLNIDPQSSSTEKLQGSAKLSEHCSAPGFSWSESIGSFSARVRSGARVEVVSAPGYVLERGRGSFSSWGSGWSEILESAR